MKKITFLFILVLARMVIYAQSGVNTTTPQQQLQVSGATSSTPIGTAGIKLVNPTIRIDGLNNTNNTVAKNSSSVVQPVDVTQDGDFILSPNLAIPLFSNLPGTDAINPAVTVTTTDTLFKSLTLKTYTFTLNQTSMVHFLASVSASVFNTSGTRAGDGKNKICSSTFRFTSAPAGSGIALNTSFGTEMFDYYNTSTTIGTTGNMYLQPEAYLVLPPGSYTVILLGQALGSSFTFSAVFGQGTDDMVSIVATPL